MKWFRRRERDDEIRELECERDRALAAADLAEDRLLEARRETIQFRLQGVRLRRHGETVDVFAELFRREGFGGA